MRTLHFTGDTNRSETSVDSFISNLPELLGAMVVDPRCFVAIADFSDGRYVQFWVEPDGTVICEVISNLHIGAGVALGDDDEVALRRDGWGEPSPGPNPNWHVTTNDAAGLLRSVAMVRRAVYDVLGERPNGRVEVRTWCHEARGATSSDDQRTASRVRYQQALREIRADLEGD